MDTLKEKKYQKSLVSSAGRLAIRLIRENKADPLRQLIEKIRKLQ